MIDARQRLEPSAQRGTSAFRRFLPYTLVLSDAVLIYSAFILAYWIRYSLEIGPPIQQRVAFDAYQPLAGLLLGIMVGVLLLKGAYRTRMSTDVVDEFIAVFSAATISVAGIVVITSMLHQDQYSRGVVVYVWLLVIALVGLGRVLYRLLQGYCHRRGWGTRRVLVVGSSDAGKIAMQSMTNRPDLGYQLAGFVYHGPAAQIRDFGRFRALGTVSDIPELIESGQIDDVIIALPASAHEEVWPILALCEQHGVGLKLIPDLFEMNLSRVRVDDIAGIPLLDVRERPVRRLERVVKRVVDVGLSCLALLITLPLTVLIMLLIRLETRGPAVLRQERMGTGGQAFRCYKLRTMRRDADELRPALQSMNDTAGPIFKIKDDPRQTKIGRRIRRWSLDELPQLLNVLKGDMSIVGPRPPLPAEVAEYEGWQLRRLEVKPGMTGMWQVSGRSDLSFDEMVLMDIYYVDNWSLALDARILLRTVFAVLGRHGAY